MVKKPDAENETAGLLELVDKAEPEWIPEVFSVAAEQRGQRAKPYICVIDDDEMIRDFVSGMLRPRYMVFTAENGNKGIQLYNQKAPDLLFLDIDMPKHNGIEVLQYLLSHDPQAKVIMLTAHKTEKKVLEAQKLGAIGYITKPFTQKKLMQYVDAKL